MSWNPRCLPVQLAVERITAHNERVLHGIHHMRALISIEIISLWARSDVAASPALELNIFPTSLDAEACAVPFLISESLPSATHRTV
jgi:hypothetical protein